MIQKQADDTLLVIIDGLDWNDPAQHLQMLQNKLHRYLDFIETGEVTLDLPSREALLRRVLRSAWKL